jgi:threonine dehydrogenase-like Zn-dependent dehydrogenase
VGKHQDRLHLAKRLGVPSAVLQKELEPGNWGVVFEASGKAAGLSAAIEVAAEGGRVVLAGDYGRDPTATYATTIVRKELRLIGSNASSGAWDEAVRLASIRAVDLTAITPLVLPFARWPEALEAARGRRAPRVVLRHPAADAQR